MDALTEALQAFEAAYQTALRDNMFFQLGIQGADLDSDLTFLHNLFNWMTETQIPWHQFFFDWFGGNLSRERSQSSPSAEYYTAAAFSAVQESYHLFSF